VYVVGFIVVNVHYARFRLLTFDLVRGQYVAAGLLFLLFTTAPVLTGLLVPVRAVYSAREPGPEARRVRKGVVAAVLGLILCLIADYLLAYLYDSIAVSPSAHGFNMALVYGLVCNAFSIFAVVYVLLGRDQGRSSKAGVSPGASPDRLRSLRRLIHGVAEAPMHLLSVVLLASLFGGQVYPGIEPAYGGGGAWIAEILTPASEVENVPARWRGALVARDDAYLTVIPCPGALGPEQPRKSVEVRLDAVAGWTLLGQVDPEVFLKATSPAECTRAQ
jgi:hypothetical protein